MVKTLLQLLIDEFFPNAVGAVLSIIQFVMWFVSAVGLLLGVIEIPTKLDYETGEQFHWYLWVTFVSSTLFIALTAVLSQRLLSSRRRLQRQEDDAKKSLDRERELFNRATKLQHRMNEAVRRAASPELQFDMRTGLENVLGSQLIEYLRQFCGIPEFHVTIKAISGAGEYGEYRLTDRFRDAEQDKTLRRPGESESLHENYIYQRFKNATREDSRHIYICDTESEPVTRNLRERARTRGYQSILAFPLNMPASLQPDKTQGPGFNRLIGFLGLDSPNQKAFDSLVGVQETDTMDKSGGNSARCLDLFYGLADAAATILMPSASMPEGEK